MYLQAYNMPNRSDFLWIYSSSKNYYRRQKITGIWDGTGEIGKERMQKKKNERMPELYWFNVTILTSLKPTYSMQQGGNNYHCVWWEMENKYWKYFVDQCSVCGQTQLELQITNVIISDEPAFYIL